MPVVPPLAGSSFHLAWWFRVVLFAPAWVALWGVDDRHGSLPPTPCLPAVFSSRPTSGDLRACRARDRWRSPIRTCKAAGRSTASALLAYSVGFRYSRCGRPATAWAWLVTIGLVAVYCVVRPLSHDAARVNLLTNDQRGPILLDLSTLPTPSRRRETGLPCHGETATCHRRSLMLEIRDITKRYGALAAVNHVSFTAAPGEVVGYLGPNGSGKSTTVNMLVGLLPPTGGTILFDGRDIQDAPDRIQGAGRLRSGRGARLHLPDRS